MLWITSDLNLLPSNHHVKCLWVALATANMYTYTETLSRNGVSFFFLSFEIRKCNGQKAILIEIIHMYTYVSMDWIIVGCMYLVVNCECDSRSHTHTHISYTVKEWDKWMEKNWKLWRYIFYILLICSIQKIKWYTTKYQWMCGRLMRDNTFNLKTIRDTDNNHFNRFNIG